MSSSRLHALVPFQIQILKPTFPSRHTQAIYLFSGAVVPPKKADSALLMHQTKSSIDSAPRCCWCWFRVRWQNKYRMSCIWIFVMFADTQTHTSLKMSPTLSSLSSLLERVFLSIISVFQWDSACVTGRGWNSMLFSTFLWAMCG